MTFKLYIKIGVILLLALLLLIPLGMISVVVHERSSYRSQVISDIETTWTGPQRVAGPVLSLPYWVDVEQSVPVAATGKSTTKLRRTRRVLYRLPESLSIASNASTETRTIGLYSVPVFTSQHDITGWFDASDLEEKAKSIAGFVSWGQPQLTLSVNNTRGIAGRPALVWNNERVNFAAGSRLANFPAGVHANVTLPDTRPELERIPVSVTLALRGSQELSFAPLAQDVAVSLKSDWPHPKFDGEFLPDERQISSEGFDAQWRTSAFATDAAGKLSACTRASECHALNKLSFGVKFFEPVDIYVKVNRAIKYGVLFIALTFVAFFLTETLTRSRLHPLQYALVGLALAVFYLLLVSLSEHMSFGRAYGLATLACAGLIGVYLRGVLGRAGLASTFSVGIALLYTLLFFILKSEDFALLMGSLLLFAMLSLVMLLTRGIDWYKVGKPGTDTTQP